MHGAAPVNRKHLNLIFLFHERRVLFHIHQVAQVVSMFRTQKLELRIVLLEPVLGLRKDTYEVVISNYKLLGQVDFC